MDKAYNHKEVEEKIYKYWEEKGYFRPEVNPDGKPFSMVLPPPNVTGNLHIGHGLMLVVEDILVRFHRMKGDKTLWLPGTDHAAIATQSKVETELYKKEDKTRYDLGRQEFLKRVEDFASNSHDNIVHQIKRLGASVDWSREAYTLDEKRELSVRTAFLKMYELGLIYRGETIINWDSKMQTTVSDDEIEWIEEKTPLYYLKYGPFVIATARPETKFGDKYVVMHPQDERYKKYNDGDKIEVDWISGKVEATVVKDEAIDMSFGTGVMTITPWHDKTDYEIAKRHNLDFEQVIDFKGKLLSIAGELEGIHIKKARPMVVEKLKEKGLLEKIDENYTHRIGTNYRGGGVIEPQIKKQWMVGVNTKFKMQDSKLKGIESGQEVTLRELMRHVVDSGEIVITPKHFEKIYFHWIDNLRDWCISRQIWYGHRIPVWYKGDDVYVGVKTPQEDGWEQDEDTLDTWFSSGLWTFSTLGWPEDTDDLSTFHPTSILETGYDILFFWVARMILMSTCLLGEVPFHKVLLHGLVRDADKQKMSKSKGNVIDPLNISDIYGTDALRLALVFSTAAGSDIPMSEDKVRGMKFFANKLWNIARFIEINSKGKKVKHFGSEIGSYSLSDGDSDVKSWSMAIRGELESLEKEVTSNLENFQLHLAASRLYEYTWHKFADEHVETSKKFILLEGEGAEYARGTMLDAYQRILKLLHPFMPFITEEIYQKLYGEDKALIIENWPQN